MGHAKIYQYAGGRVQWFVKKYQYGRGMMQYIDKHEQHIGGKLQCVEGWRFQDENVSIYKLVHVCDYYILYLACLGVRVRQIRGCRSRDQGY